MMLAELENLLAHVANPEAGQAEYRLAIERDNCLLKCSGKTRQLTARHLASLYGLAPDTKVFWALRYFWSRDSRAHPLLALLCACARDPLLRSTAPFILAKPEGSHVASGELADFIEKGAPGRFSKATLLSAAQNINSTWTQSGHLRGKSRKIRTRPQATAANAAYALYLGWLGGMRGQSLFLSDSMKLLDCPPATALELAASAAARGWLGLNRIGEIIEVRFPFLCQENS